MAKPKGDAGGGGRGGGGAAKLLLAGFLAYAVSWFTPAVKQLGVLPTPTEPVGWAEAFGNLPDEAVHGVVDTPDWLPGWGAFRFSFHLLTGEPDRPDDKAGNRRIAGASCLSNVAMLAALLLILSRGPLTRVLGLLLIGSTALNASWLYLPDGNPFAFLRAGYYLWLVSFPLVGLGLLIRPGKAP